MLTPREAYETAIFLSVVGAVLVWLGIMLVLRPVDVAGFFMRGVNRDSKSLLYRSLLPRPEKAKLILQVQGVFLVILAGAMIVGAVRLFVAIW